MNENEHNLNYFEWVHELIHHSFIIIHIITVYYNSLSTAS